MSQRCKTCAHPDAKKIDKAILSKHAYTRIASKFGLHPKSVENHAKTHLQPVVDKANKIAEAAIVAEVLQFRREVNYVTLDKIKLLQEKILTDLDTATKPDVRIPLYREFRGYLQEQAKILGEYQQDRKNELDNEALIQQVTERLVKEQGWQEERAALAAKQFYSTDVVSNAVN